MYPSIKAIVRKGMAPAQAQLMQLGLIAQSHLRLVGPSLYPLQMVNDRPGRMESMFTPEAAYPASSNYVDHTGGLRAPPSPRRSFE